MLTRRHLMTTALAATAGATLIRPFAAMAQDLTGDVYDTDGGQISIHPVAHASFVLVTPAGVLYVDPVGGADAYDALPDPDAVLITHEHGDHYDPDTLSALAERAGGSLPMITNPAVAEMLAPELAEGNAPLANGESGEILGYTVDAVPAYNTTEDRLQYHPEGRDNGYVLSVDGLRIYIAGDTEDTPEFRAQEEIDIAFVPFNLPYTMTEDQAASGVAEMGPKVVYPYHFRGSDPEMFTSLLSEAGSETDVVMGGWYSQSES
ncbi:MBL fold metallo-hydrolase [Pseudooceanicola marinus]|uniref:MBL fold metallo-hydrolase n=1 Tax=Pseudooceanicola marinus TaxID=396013 RepID=UPI001CD621C2|nr:MBL fold metallo-hydrolase [Pseudooceanicola marinus]MCA1336465.1 MBL fold metallo-hydrolase [Pseudooceanicola marinus]